MLKALELVGFKSFADKTRLEFGEGVTCVVGPNGSGKSNVVDAIKWVLGSQSPKALRGSEMTDVIFNGAAGRRPLNTAEVTLEFDNGDGLFEINEPLVRITRRVYRSGEGEYAINGAGCRLRDIRELLAGTGVGAEAYNIIEQGRVDAVLRASPKDRRALFEEAAGISRFRLKKQEAARRLARVEQNLLRLSDIVDEVEGRLRRVRMQAGKARRYREQADRLQELRTQLGLADWRAITVKLTDLEHEDAELSASLTSLQAELEEGEARQQSLDQQAQQAADRLAQIDRQMSQVRERIAARGAAVEAETVRLVELAEARVHARRRVVAVRTEAQQRAGGDSPAQVRRRLDDAKKELANATAVANQARGEQQQQEQRVASLREEGRKLENQREQLQRAIRDATRQTELIAVRQEVAETQRVELNAAQERLGKQHAAAAEQLRVSQQTGQQLDVKSLQVRRALESTQAIVDKLQQQLAAGREQLAASEAEALARQGQLSVLQAAETQLDQLRVDTQRLLKPASDRKVAKIHGLVADVLHVDFDTAPIIEAALGERAHHLVIDDGQALLDAVLADPDSLTTRASFQRLDSRRAGSAVDRIDLSDLPGVMGRADKFVEAESEYTLLVDRLLARTWLVDTLETAQQLASGEGRGLSFVTFAGEVVSADGTIIAGPQGDAAGVLTRRKQIALIREAATEGQAGVEQLSTAVADTQQKLGAAESQMSQLAAQQTALSEELAEHRQRAAALGERTDRLAEELARVRAEQARNQALVESLSGEIDSTRAAGKTGSSSLEQLQARLEEVANQTAVAERQLAERGAEAMEARVAIARHEQHAEILAEQIEQLRRDASQRRDADAEATVAIAAAEKRAIESELSLLANRAELAELYLSLQRLSSSHLELDRDRQTTTTAQRRLAKQCRHFREKVDQIRLQSQQVKLEADRLRLERKNLADRMQDDYDIDLAAAAGEDESAPILVENRKSLEEELAGLRGQVSSVGAVNLESLEELDELEERFEELSSQYRDLSEAKATLERLTTRISTESRQLFLATVEEVRGHFRELFRQLFGGGEADIILQEAEADDPLDAGVEIAASPPGKELRSISLLSGGEKTMTCVALLLAVFRTKPSPFCMLDEVDAALDEANIGRFTSVLSEFLSSTQFIVVTHSKKTMTGANTLYGVTMQESGISMQVAVRFEDVGEDGQINPAATLRRWPGSESQSRAA